MFFFLCIHTHINTYLRKVIKHEYREILVIEKNLDNIEYFKNVINKLWNLRASF